MYVYLKENDNSQNLSYKKRILVKTERSDWEQDNWISSG